MSVTGFRDLIALSGIFLSGGITGAVEDVEAGALPPPSGGIVDHVYRQPGIYPELRSKNPRYQVIWDDLVKAEAEQERRLSVLEMEVEAELPEQATYADRLEAIDRLFVAPVRAELVARDRAIRALQAEQAAIAREEEAEKDRQIAFEAAMYRRDEEEALEVILACL